MPRFEFYADEHPLDLVLIRMISVGPVFAFEASYEPDIDQVRSTCCGESFQPSRSERLLFFRPNAVITVVK